MTLGQLNLVDQTGFVAVCGPFFEHSPWIAEHAWFERPFTSLTHLHDVMRKVVDGADAEQQLELIRAHPDLVGRLARDGRLTSDSSAEQSAAGLTRLSESEAAAFDRYNAAYRERFGFPFVICARQNRKEAILAAFPSRLQNDRETEVAAALQEIYKIARLRMGDAIKED